MFIGFFAYQFAAHASDYTDGSSNNPSPLYHFRRNFLMRSLFVMVFLCLSTFALSQQKGPADELPKLEHLHADQVNPQIDPCTDFYQYSCSKFFAANPIPPDRASWGVAGPLQVWNETVLRQALEAAAAKKQGRTPVEQKIGDYWTSCMDESAIETASAKAFQAELKRIDDLKQKSQLVDQIAHLHSTIGDAWAVDDNATFAPLFGLSAIQDYDDAQKTVAQFDQGGFSLPGRDFYSKDDAKSQELRKAYLMHVQKMLELLGDKPETAAAEAQTIMRIETALAQGSMTRVERRDPQKLYHKMTAQEFEALTPSFQWNTYFTKVGLPSIASLNVATPDFFKTVSAEIDKEDLASWKTYLRWHLVEANARYLIRLLLVGASSMVSGHSPVGGIDIWAEEEALALGVPLDLKVPTHNSWDPPGGYGYKARNLDIARDSDVVHVLLADVYPEQYTGRRWDLCYHCKTNDHVKSGARCPERDREAGRTTASDEHVMHGRRSGLRSRR